MGQCAVTALIVQDLFGGVLLRGLIDGKPQESHYWNKLYDGQKVDLTCDQFDGGKASITDIKERTREYVLSDPNTLERYKRLRANLAETKPPLISAK